MFCFVGAESRTCRVCGTTSFVEPRTHSVWMIGESLVPSTGRSDRRRRYAMPRRRIVPRKPTIPDPRFGSTVVAKFVSRMMLDGKKSVAQNAFYGAMDEIERKGDAKPLEVFLKAIENVKPVVEVKSRRVGGSTYQVPVEIRDSRREALAMRWLIAAARARSGRSMSQKLSGELMDAANQSGTAFKKKEDTHRMAEANKAFSHYRW